MNYYTIKYPKEILLDGGEKEKSGIKDSLNRNIVVNVKIEEEKLRSVFEKVGFKEVILERKKEKQIGRGMRKRINKFCDIHIRLLNLKEGEISIDAEIEISREYLQHIRSNVFTIVNEVEDVLKDFNIQFRLFHKSFQRYIEKIIEETEIVFAPPKTLLYTTPAVAGFLIATFLFFAM